MNIYLISCLKSMENKKNMKKTVQTPTCDNVRQRPTTSDARPTAKIVKSKQNKKKMKLTFNILAATYQLKSAKKTPKSNMSIQVRKKHSKQQQHVNSIRTKSNSTAIETIQLP